MPVNSFVDEKIEDCEKHNGDETHHEEVAHLEERQNWLLLKFIKIIELKWKIIKLPVCSRLSRAGVFSAM